MPDNRRSILLDTLGALSEHRHGLAGWCLDCSALYRMDALPGECVRASFDIDLDALIATRGAGASVIRMPPVPCPRCGGRRTECRITVSGKELIGDR